MNKFKQWVKDKEDRIVYTIIGLIFLIVSILLIIEIVKLFKM